MGPGIVEPVRDREGRPLVCAGCAHADARAPFPGRPSGERPCCFCSRNPLREEEARARRQAGLLPVEVWYDGSKPVKLPMDCYHSPDMSAQLRIWADRDLLYEALNERVRELAERGFL